MLRTSEFLPYVVFLQAPEFEVLKAMNNSVVEAGMVTKTVTVSMCVENTSLAQQSAYNSFPTGNRSNKTKRNMIKPNPMFSVSG